MTMPLRAIAVAVALAGVLDPACTVRRVQPAVVELRADQEPATGALADRVRTRLAGTLSGSVVFEAAESPDAVVFVERIAPGAEAPPEHVPVSLVTSAAAGAAVRLGTVRVWPGERVVHGQAVAVSVELELDAPGDRTVVVTLEQNGIEMSRSTHRGTSRGERQQALLAYAPPAPGVNRVRAVARVAGEAAVLASRELAVISEARTLPVLVYEPRPSWSTAFARRSLESSGMFDVSSYTGASRGQGVRGGRPPARLTADAIGPYAAVLVGAPESLAASDVAALTVYARQRGGAVVLLPDTRPAGPYMQLLPGRQFEEVLLSKPAVLAAGSLSLRASELIVPRDPGRSASSIAGLNDGGASRPVVISWPAGAGTVVFSGALDAWRYRAEANGEYGRFWSGLVARVAAAAPDVVNVTVAPILARPGEEVVVRGRVRRTEFQASGAERHIPAVSAALVSDTGALRPIRLWPAAEEGLFEGTFRAETPGRWTVRVTAGRGAAETPVVVDPLAPGPVRASLAAGLVTSNGGVAVVEDDLGPLERHLRSLARRERSEVVHPMRSWWWLLPFTAGLCLEWVVRRQRGRR